MARESEPVHQPEDAADRQHGPLERGDADEARRQTASIEVKSDTNAGGAGRAEGTRWHLESESGLTEEERLHGVLMRNVLRPRLASWRSALVPGGLRLMAREMRLDRVPVGARASRTERLVKDAQGSRERRGRAGPTVEQLAHLIELISISISRLLLLRVAGLRRKEQMRLRHIARTQG